jgi:hypothetical protein
MAKRALQLRKTAASEIPKDNASVDRLTVMSWQRVARCSLLMTVVSLSLSGCLLGPDYQRPDLALPARYNAPELGAATSAPASAPTATSASASGAVQAPVNAQWWTLFGDATLNQLVQAARQDNADIQVYPNPASGSISVKIAESLQGQFFSIIDLVGRLLRSGSFNSIQQEISLENLSPGIYYLKAGLAVKRFEIK